MNRSKPKLKPVASVVKESLLMFYGFAIHTLAIAMQIIFVMSVIMSKLKTKFGAVSINDYDIVGSCFIEPDGSVIPMNGKPHWIACRCVGVKFQEYLKTAVRVMFRRDTMMVETRRGQFTKKQIRTIKTVISRSCLVELGVSVGSSYTEKYKFTGKIYPNDFIKLLGGKKNE